MRRLILLPLLCCIGLASAEVYTWKDADGKTHYSDKAPANNPPSLKALPPPPPGIAPQSPVPKRESLNIPVVNQAQEAQDQRDARVAACQDARDSLKEIDDAPRRVARGRGGKTFALDGDERSADRERFQKAIADNC